MRAQLVGSPPERKSLWKFPKWRRLSGQKPVDNFLNEEGQIRLGKRQAQRQAKIVAGANFKIARILFYLPAGGH